VPTNMPSQARRPTNWSHMLTYISVLILVGTEIFDIAFARAWAIGGLFELGDPPASFVSTCASVA